MEKIMGQTFKRIHLKQKDKVTTLASINCSLNAADKKITVYPLTLFQRVCIVKQTNKNLKQLFSYELAPFPMSFFNEEGMRKGTKSALYDAEFTPINVETNLGSRKYNVIDGGFLLDKVVWSKSTTPTFQIVCKTYLGYAMKHFGLSTTIVFHGYPDRTAY